MTIVNRVVKDEEIVAEILKLKEYLIESNYYLDEFIDDGKAHDYGCSMSEKLNGVAPLVLSEALVEFFIEEDITSNVVRVEFNDKRIFIGCLPNGAGTLSYPNGSRYVGLMKNFAPHGFGVLNNSNGTVIQGEWVHGVLHGKAAFFDKKCNPTQCVFDSGNLVMIDKSE